MKQKILIALLMFILGSVAVLAADQGPGVYIYLANQNKDWSVTQTYNGLVWAILYNIDGQPDAAVDECQIWWESGWESVSIGSEGAWYYVNHSYDTIGDKTVYYKCKNDAGFWSVTVSDSIEILNSPPTLTGIQVSPDPVPGGNTVNVTPIGADDPNLHTVDYYCSENSVPDAGNTVCTGGVLSAADPYDRLLCMFNAPNDSALHTLYCRLYDGSAYSPTRSYIYQTNSSPTGLTIQVNGGASTTTSGYVTLDLYTINAFECRYKNEDVASGNQSAWSAWELYTTSRANWYLVSGIPVNNGQKRVYYQCRSTFGEQSQVVSDDIILAADPPIPEFSLFGFAVAIVGSLGVFFIVRKR